MKKLEATLATVSLTMAEPGQQITRNRELINITIPDLLEILTFQLIVFVIALLTIWHDIIRSLVATIDFNTLCYDLPITFYASFVTAGILVCVLVKTGGGLIRL